MIDQATSRKERLAFIGFKRVPWGFIRSRATPRDRKRKIIKTLHFHNEWNTHMSSKNHEASGYGLDMDLLVYLILYYLECFGILQEMDRREEGSVKITHVHNRSGLDCYRSTPMLSKLGRRSYLFLFLVRRKKKNGSPGHRRLWPVSHDGVVRDPPGVMSPATNQLGNFQTFNNYLNDDS